MLLYMSKMSQQNTTWHRLPPKDCIGVIVLVVIVTDPWRGREGAATDAIVMVHGFALAFGSILAGESGNFKIQI